MPWTEANLLKLAKQIGQVKRVRQMPALSEGAVEPKSFEGVPMIAPNRRDIPYVYPTGVL